MTATITPTETTSIAGSIAELKHRHTIGKLDADIAEYSTWLKGNPTAPAEHREMAQSVLRKSISLRKRLVALRHEERQAEEILRRAGGNIHARCIDYTDQAMAERAANPDAPLPSTRVDALADQARAEREG